MVSSFFFLRLISALYSNFLLTLLLATIRHTIAETLLLLCSTRWGREKLRNSGVYEVIRAAHLAEKDEGVSAPVSIHP